jgi:hypothetical protein
VCSKYCTVNVSCNAVLKAVNYLAAETGFNVSSSLHRKIALFCVAANKSEINTTSVVCFPTERRIFSSAFLFRLFVVWFAVVFLSFFIM